MNNLYKVIFAAMVLLVATLAFTTTASAIKYGKLDKYGGIGAYLSDGSLTPLTYRWSQSGLLVIATLPNGYRADVPTKIVVTYTYRNGKLVEGRKKTTFRKWFGKRKMRKLSVELHAQLGKQIPNAYVIDQIKHPKPVSMGRTRTVVFWMTFPCIQPVDFVFLQPQYPDVANKMPNWVCMPPNLEIFFEAIITKSRPRTFATFGHSINQVGAFVYPAPPPTPVVPIGPTGPSSPTS